MNRQQIRDGKAIQRRTGRTFHLATRLLPKRIRHATYVLYAFFRIADDVVDDPTRDLSPEEQRERLEALRAEALGEVRSDEPVIRAFCDLRETYDIDDEEVDEFVDAMVADIETARYQTYEDVEAYMRGSASAVGVMMTDLMNPDEYDTAVPHAVALGKAFQLTNFLRDVREDVLDRNRIYLPVETLDDHGVDVEQVESLRFSPEFADAMQHEMRRTESLYRDGVAGIKYLPRDCQFAVLLSAVLYAEHHRVIRERGYDVLSADPELTMAQKLAVLAKIRWHWTWNKDPEAVFRRVSAVPYGGVSHHEHESGGASPVR